ncbi:hypothetical protein D9M71_694860 [compost metagenome]
MGFFDRRYRFDQGEQQRVEATVQGDQVVGLQPGLVRRCAPRGGKAVERGAVVDAAPDQPFEDTHGHGRGDVEPALFGFEQGLEDDGAFQALGGGTAGAAAQAGGDTHRRVAGGFVERAGAQLEHGLDEFAVGSGDFGVISSQVGHNYYLNQYMY